MFFNKESILGFETDTVWGIGCHPLNKKAVDKIYEIKGRDKSKPLILMSSKTENLMPYIAFVPDFAKELMDKYFPGGLTLIFEKSALCPDFITSNKNTVGIRVPNHKGFYGIAENFEGKVLATTSLNAAGEPPVESYGEAYNKYHESVTILKPDSYGMPSKKASTVVLCTGKEPVVLRQGEIFI